MSKEITVEKNENKEALNHDNSGHAYELAFHLVPSLGDDNVGKVFEEITKLVEKNKGKIVSKSEPALLNLEYTMEKIVDAVKSKYNTAYFAWIIFDSGDVIKLDEDLKHNSNVLRYIIAKTKQRDSIPAIEVANILNEGAEGKDVEVEEVKVEETTEVVEEDEKEELIEEKKETKENAEKVDEAIDDLIK